MSMLSTKERRIWRETKGKGGGDTERREGKKLECRVSGNQYGARSSDHGCLPVSLLFRGRCKVAIHQSKRLSPNKIDLVCVFVSCVCVRVCVFVCVVWGKVIKNKLFLALRRAFYCVLKCVCVCIYVWVCVCVCVCSLGGSHLKQIVLGTEKGFFTGY